MTEKQRGFLRKARESVSAARLLSGGDYDVGAALTAEDAALHMERADEFIRVAEETIDRLPAGSD